MLLALPEKDTKEISWVGWDEKPPLVLTSANADALMVGAAVLKC
jgi:hypothetical protein